MAGRRPGKFLGELLLHVKLFLDTAMKQPRRSPVLRRSRECDFFLLGFPGIYPCPQFFPIPPPPRSNFSASFLPTSPQANFIPEPSSLISPGSYPTQSWRWSKTHPLSRGGVAELSGSVELIAEALEVLRVDNSLLSHLLQRNIYFLIETNLSQCFFTPWFKDSDYQNSHLG